MLKSLTILGFGLLVGFNALADFTPQTVDVGLKKSYVPVGFDDNDRTTIAVEGLFPNTCYRVGPHSLKIDHTARTIHVQQEAYLYGGTCLQMFVPFTQVIDLGILENGTYTISDAQTGATLGQLPIKRSTNVGPDDYLYAPVSDAYVTYDALLKKNTLVLNGSFGDRCSDIEQIKIDYQKEVIVVQPIVKRTTEQPCAAEKMRFLKTVELKNTSQGLQLLHVRSLNGQAVNKMVDLQ